MPSLHCSSLLFFIPHLFLLCLSSQTELVLSCFTSIFSFGDSLADTGNLLHSHPDKAGYVGRLPYGQTYFHHPTGRFSDGRLVIDFIAQEIGLPLLAPYLASSSRVEELRKGANFAVGGATAIDVDYFKEKGVSSGLITNCSLGLQISLFKRLLPSLCNSTSSCNNLVRNSLFVIGEIGGNDYNLPFLEGLSLEDGFQDIVPRVVTAIASGVTRLIGNGAVRVVVAGVPPFGCGAQYLTLAQSPNREEYDSTGCIKKGNEFAEHHNNLLQKELDRLRELHPHCTIVYADYYNAAMQVFTSPSEYGFSKDILKACCGGGGSYNYNFTAGCGAPGTSVCSDPTVYWHWDGVHHTEAASRWLANDMIHGPYTDPPISSVCRSISLKLNNPYWKVQRK